MFCMIVGKITIGYFQGAFVFCSRKNPIIKKYICIIRNSIMVNCVKSIILQKNVCTQLQT